MNSLGRKTLGLTVARNVLYRNTSSPPRTFSTKTLSRLYLTQGSSGILQWHSVFKIEARAPWIGYLRGNVTAVQQLRFNQTKAGEQETKEQPKEEEESKESKEEGEGKEKEAPPPPPPPHGDKSPFAVFYETIQKELKKSQEWQESTKAIADSAQQFTESPAVRKAREAYEASAKASAQAASKGTEKLIKTAKVVGEGAAWTWNTPVVKAGRTVVRKTGEGVAAVTKPVRDTKAYQDATKTVKEVIDDGSSSRYGGFLEKEERRKARELREKEILKRAPPPPKFDEDPK